MRVVQCSILIVENNAWHMVLQNKIIFIFYFGRSFYSQSDFSSIGKITEMQLEFEYQSKSKYFSPLCPIASFCTLYCLHSIYNYLGNSGSPNFQNILL